MNEISEELHNFLDKLPKNVLKVLLLEALDIMNENNSNSSEDAIFIAMDAVRRGDDTWRIPSLNSVKEIFS
jgi:hypothetical protein